MSYKPDGERALKTLRFLYERRELGATWFELAEHYGWHHGQASAALSTLHRDNRISRLTEKRGKSFVYVDSMFVDARETSKYGKIHRLDQQHVDEAYTNAVNAVAAIIPAVTNAKNPLIHTRTCWREHPECALRLAIKQIRKVQNS